MLNIAVDYQIPEQRVQDLLCCALEGGSNYWYVLKEKRYPPGQDKDSLGMEFPHLELPFKGGSLVIGDWEGQEKDSVLDIEAVKRGLALLSHEYPLLWGEFLKENEDAETGDVFLQLACFGKVIFG